MARPRSSSTKTKHKETPLMRQYYAIKKEHPGAVLLFRVGDFYETFGSDAVEVSHILGIVLTKRSNGAASEVDLAGFPHHALDTYLPKLVRAGKRVAVCDQLEDPKQAKGIVKRGVTELVSPGMTFNDKVLEGNKPNFLASVHFPDTKRAGVAFLEVSTGDFFCFSGPGNYVEKVLHTLAPSEILIPRREQKRFKEWFGEDFYLTRVDEWVFQESYAREKLLKLFRCNTLKGFGIDSEIGGIVAAGSIVYFLNENHQNDLGHIRKIYLFDDSNFVWLDQFTVRNLELVQPLHPGGTALVDVLDRTSTAMGARALRKALLLPLKDLKSIQRRSHAVKGLIAHPPQLDHLIQLLQQMGDLERMASKTATFRLAPKEAAALRRSLQLVAPICETLIDTQDELLTAQAHQFESPERALHTLTRYLQDEIKGTLADGNVIREGISAELDELREMKRNSRQLLLDMQQREMKATSISSLKIGFNKVFGYYLEVTHAHKNKVPNTWMRKQTLTNAERYITEELKSYEEKILNAEERIQKMEAELYQQFMQELQAHLEVIQHNAHSISELDLLVCFAQAAKKNGYVMPKVEEGSKVDIRSGRHPVIETKLPSDKPYIPNDIFLDNKDQQIVIITGPNMAGKSALLRQTALIVLMAQMGSFVPADAAHIGIVDKIFTRVGASDNISSGESTFMVEMNETAQIANNATQHSLILLDEIGRGTSTYDGVSIAWALVEYLHETPNYQAKTLFATHYHELNELENRLERVYNYNVSVKEVDGKILFMRKLVKGGSEHSFGINVAEMAGMPPILIKRAKQLLSHFEQHKLQDKEISKKVKFSTAQTVQLNMFELKDPDTLKIREILSGVDIDRMTPVEALLKLQEIKKALFD